MHDLSRGGARGTTRPPSRKRPYVDFARPSISEDEIRAVTDCLRSGWLTTGPVAHRFETDFATYMGGLDSVAVNSATAGLHLALACADVGPGDAVLTTTYTFTATAEVARYVGAELVLVDIDPATMNMDVGQTVSILESRPDVAAVIPVHFAGQPCDMDPIAAAARNRDAVVIEDAAHALPARYRGRLVGTLGDFGVFSFYATKPLATGEGGMVTTSAESDAARLRLLGRHGIEADAFARYAGSGPSWYYEVVEAGFKYNLMDPVAAIGIEQLKRIDGFQRRREEIADRYHAAFAGLPLRTPYVEDGTDLHAWHLYVIQLDLADLAIDRDAFIVELDRRGVGTSVHFIPLHVHPYWRDRYGFKPEEFPSAMSVYECAVSLPIYPDMSDGDVEHVIEAVTDVCEHAT
ncbi:MAG: DegT/DnrJ/EryC1/StrS aminotransferase family protein [Acidimicrobiia bacterium]|nr:DegT/DnrJ/EryC1/StrS aminotransferase family protein [Acidimicrobiia bacterium]